MACYLERFHLDWNLATAFWLDCECLNESFSKGLSSQLSFCSIYEDTINRLKQRKFEAYSPRKRDIRLLQNECGLTNKQFASYFGIPVRTIENWRHKPDSCTDYLYDLIEYKLLNEGII